jgi:SHR-binding domain of vacuolar-sorting associated protein 13
MKSWFEGGSSKGRIDSIELVRAVKPGEAHSSVDDKEQTEWWRMLSLRLTNFTLGAVATSEPSTVQALNRPLNVTLFLQKAAWHNRKMSLRCRFSLADMTLKYSQYCLLCAVVNGNVGKGIDKDKWDNVEKAYDLEVMEAEGIGVQPVQPRHVEYATGARHVRFGQQKAQDKVSPSLHQNGPNGAAREGLVKVQLILDGVALKLHRDDPATTVAQETYCYDMLLLKVHQVEVDINNNASEDFSFQLALYRITLLDLGDQGRLLRERLHATERTRPGLRLPCAFAVLVEGYARSEDESLLQRLGPMEIASGEPQLILTVDKVPVSTVGTIGSFENHISSDDSATKVTLAKLVLNYLSVNALIRPFTELVSFLLMSWPSPERDNETRGSNVAMAKPASSTQADRDNEPSESNVTSTSSSLQIKLVAHYPRIFFVADESDPHSRALVLRGLAVVNAGRTIKRCIGDEVRTDVVVDGQLHSLESYMNPDVFKALRLQQRHTVALVGVSVLPLLSPLEEDEGNETDLDDEDELGVALLQPVTAGLEYGRTNRSRFPTQRKVCIIIEPISTMVSFEDLQLIESVFNRWATGRGDSASFDFEMRPRLDGESNDFDVKDIETDEGAIEEERTPITSYRRNKFTVRFRCGLANGLVLERSSLVSFPVATKVDPCISLAALPAATSESALSPRLPRTGALVVALNGGLLTENNFSDALSFILKHGESDNPELIRRDSYALTFIEIESESWGNHDAFDLCLQGAVVTFIDDLDGKDMPLFRGTLESMEINYHSGVGINTRILERNKDLACLVNDTSVNDLADSNSVTLRIVARTTVEYFHPRKALYEPFVEPAQFCVNYECHSGNVFEGRSGHVALEISDSAVTSADASGTGGEAHVISVNFSDASTEVLAKALREWANWRKMVQEASSLSFSAAPLNVATSSIHQGARQSLTLGNDALKSSYASGMKDFEATAVQAAFVFAKKRGAERSGKSEASKPFVFKNRTGVSVAFVQQDAEPRQFAKRTQPKEHNSFVGEYLGLDRYARSDIVELADGEDAKFQMDYVSLTSKSQEQTKKVRAYDGQFPYLRVAIQSIAGVAIETLSDLQVQRAGSWIRDLSVQKTTDVKIFSQYTVPMVWKVEVEDNRRILTLSSAVRVVSLNAAVIEIGVQWCPVSNGDTREPREDASAVASGSCERANIQLIGVSMPDAPFYLPLSLSLRRDCVQIYVRPKFGALARYLWGKQSVLQFTLVQQTPRTLGTQWIWKETIDEVVGSIECESIGESAPSAFLSCYTTAEVPNVTAQQLDTEALACETLTAKEILSVTVDASVSIRNLLPVAIEWDVGHAVANDERNVVDSTRMRLTEGDGESLGLLSGECAEVYACNIKEERIEARFRIGNNSAWSGWTIVSSPLTGHIDSEPGSSGYNGLANSMATGFQANVCVESDFGVPIVCGVRVVPKIMAKSDWKRSTGDRYGVTIIIYAELWISNLTSLPLAFGCPSHQIRAEGNSDDSMGDATKFSAEAALMELASVLELGENGTELDTRHADMAATAGDIYLMPYQECPVITEEIFEYEECTSGTVKRRWWGSEKYWSLRNSAVLDLNDAGKPWHWIDTKWRVDSSGQAVGGWESCKDLLGGGDGPFSARRIFVPSHPFRRRRWFRTRASNSVNDRKMLDQSTHVHSDRKLLPGIQTFHQPILDSFSKAHKKARWRRKRREGNAEKDDTNGELNRLDVDEVHSYYLAVKSGDGRWSLPASVSSFGSNHGILEVYASRWPMLTNAGAVQSPSNLAMKVSDAGFESLLTSDSPEYRKAPLNPMLYELVYQVSAIDGEWGDFSRHVLVSSRFNVRNDSEVLTLEVKQAGSSDDTAVRLLPGDIAPFYWADFRVPRLVCVRPSDEIANNGKVYKWSGGFDACTLGMTALMVRHTPDCRARHSTKSMRKVRTIRTLVELRPGTGGTGINVSFKEERDDGDGALFRIENRSTFSVWMSQDGVLADPSTTGPRDPVDSDGDLIGPGERMSFGLDVPYRQGKYAGREAATMAELLHVRVGLSPLSSFAGIETTKVISLSRIGDSIRMKPTRLVTVLSPEQRRMLERVRVLVVVTADGPSRVLKFWYVVEQSLVRE